MFLKNISYIFVEVFGAVLLVFFLSMVVDTGRVVKLIPWIVALSSAASGYCVLEKGHSLKKHRYLFTAGAGCASALLLYAVLSVFFFFSNGEGPFTSWDILVFLAIGSGCGSLGGVIAAKKDVSPKQL